MTAYTYNNLSKTLVLGSVSATYSYTTSNSYQYSTSVTIKSGMSVAVSSTYPGAAGVYSATTGVSLTNNGTVSGGNSTSTGVGGTGVDLRAKYGLLTNTGSITGGNGYYGALGGRGVYLNTGTLTNSGSIRGGYVSNGGVPGGLGVQLSGGSGTNTSTGTIAGGNSIVNAASGNGGIGVSLSNSAALSNAGVVKGGIGRAVGGAGAQLQSHASITNTGTIKGGAGHSAGGIAVIDNGAILTNSSSGKITGGAGYKINGSTTASNGGTGVQLNSGATLNNSGTITGGTGIYGGTTGVGVKLAATGALLNNHGSIVDGVVMGANTTLNNYSGKIVGAAGISTVSGGAGGAGVALNGGTLTTAAAITGGAGLSGAAAGAAVQFGSSAATLVVQKYASFNGVVAGFNSNDTIDITNLSPTQIQNGNYFNAQTDVLTTPSDGTLTFTGNFTGEYFKFSADSGNGTLITLAACYLRGTRILTPAGEVAIETLKIGDAVATLSGTSRAIRWIGRRRYSRHSVAGNRDILPIRFTAGSLGDGLPHRDLWVSPEHAMWLDGALIPARALLNGMSITQDTSAEEVAYVHLELDTHDVVFAEGALSESYVDADTREHFDNVAEYSLLYPDAQRAPARFCAPRVEDGAELENIRQRLQSLAITGGNPSSAKEAPVPAERAWIDFSDLVEAGTA